MRALRFIAPFACLLLAAFDGCRPAQSPKVTAVFNNNLPIENNSLPITELGKFTISTTFSKKRKETFIVGGVTVSDFVPQFLLTFDGSTDPVSGKACLAAKTVELTLNYKPTVYIASQYKPGSCRYKEVLLHEVRHVNTDIITFKEYLPIIQADMERAAATLHVMGPLDKNEVDPAREKAAAVLKEALTASVDKVSAVLHQRQQAIDTRAEYLRSSRACPHEPILGAP
ncbi:MAG: hypothetical protein ACAH80_09100 [Alphaproteobacteria bacterium]